MRDPAAVLDTVALLAYLGGATRELGRAARRAFERTRTGRGRLAVSTLSLFEAGQLAERGRITLALPFERWCDLVERAEALLLVPLERAHVSEAHFLRALRDPFDRLIAGTAVALGVPLITPDQCIAEIGRVPTIW